MKGDSNIRRAALAVVALLATGCASANPWIRHDASSDLKAAASDPDRVCDVEILNATEGLLEASLVLEAGESRSLGLMTAGQSIRAPVACRLGRVSALGVSRDLGASEGRRFRAAARLDLRRATRLRLTHADQVAW
jgi:hypothetical protein